MTITSTTNRVSYAGDGSTTAFSFPHKFLEDADLTVILVDDSTGAETEQTITTDYTVSGAGDANGGTVTMVTAPETGETLVILDDPALTQGTDLADGSALPAETVEEVFDRLTLIAQRSRDLVERSLSLSDGDTTGASLTLPTPTALELLRWDSAGTALEGVAVTELTEAAAVLADNETLVKLPGQDANGLAMAANTVLARAGGNIEDVSLGEQVILGRITGGNIAALTPAEIIGIIDDVPVTLASAPVVSVSGTDTYSADLGGAIADGERFVGKIANDNTGTTPTFENTGGTPSGAKTITDRAANALWAGALSGEHTFEYDGNADTFLVLDPRATAANVNDAPVKRDSNGRFKAADPSAAQDVSTKAYVDGAAIPPGAMMWWPTATPPSGWLARDGSAVSRTTYSGLFDVIGTNYGSGDGSTTFNLPDDRGMFIRGFDNGAGVDPDAASRTDRGDGTTGDNVGTEQADAFKSHNHGGNTGNTNPNHSSTVVDTSTGFASNSPGTSWGDNNLSINHSHTISSDGGNETRPINRSYLPIIKT